MINWKLYRINQIRRMLFGLLFLFLSKNTFGQKNLLESTYRNNSKTELINYLETFKRENNSRDTHDLEISDTVKLLTCLIRQFYRHFNVDQALLRENDTSLINLDSCKCKNENYYGFFSFPSVYLIPKIVLEEFDIANSKDLILEKHLMHSGKLKGKYMNFTESDKFKFTNSSFNKYIKLINLKFSDKFYRDLNSFLKERKFFKNKISSKIEFLKPHLKFFKKKNNSYTIHDLYILSLSIDLDLRYVIIEFSQQSCIIASLYKINQLQSLEFLYSTIMICGQQ